MEISNIYNKNGVDKILCDKAFIIVGNQRMIDIDVE